jgi:PTH1 family peptidyl-tRNA hydrolase
VNDPLLIAGLGNPGEKYRETRHNAGFLVLESLASLWRVDWRDERRFSSLVARAERMGRTVWLLQPQTYMNASGEAVGALARYYRVEPTRILVVVDDADLPLGTVRLRPGGSPGGHHGLESVEEHLGTREYPRLRVGIGRRDEGLREITGHVLGRFSGEEWDIFERVRRHAVAQLNEWLDNGIQKAMARFNGPVEGMSKKEAL